MTLYYLFLQKLVKDSKLRHSVVLSYLDSSLTFVVDDLTDMLLNGFNRILSLTSSRYSISSYLFGFGRGVSSPPTSVTVLTAYASLNGIRKLSL